MNVSEVQSIEPLRTKHGLFCRINLSCKIKSWQILHDFVAFDISDPYY